MPCPVTLGQAPVPGRRGAPQSTTTPMTAEQAAPGPPTDRPAPVTKCDPAACRLSAVPPICAAATLRSMVFCVYVLGVPDRHSAGAIGLVVRSANRALPLVTLNASSGFTWRHRQQGFFFAAMRTAVRARLLAAEDGYLLLSGVREGGVRHGGVRGGSAS
jgi:hypothetical protein